MNRDTGITIRAGLVALALGLTPSAGFAQSLKLGAQAGAEAPLPDMDAVEKGGQTRASVSFGAPNIPPNPAATEPRTTQVTAVKRIGESAAPFEGRARPTGGIFGVEDLPDATGADTNAGPPGEVPAEHQVKDGDTLWSLCQQYFSDPWRWPQLWTLNPQITNPHWIFPGDVVRLRESGPEAPRPAPVATDAKPASRRGLDNRSILMRQHGFIDASAMAESARIVGSREEKIMLTSGDQAYVAFDPKHPLKAGERYSIYVADREHPVVGPDGKLLGYIVRVFGDIAVDQVLPNQMARGMMLDLTDPVERGYSISPSLRQFRRITPQPSSVNLEARVVASFSPAIMVAADTFVVLSRGSKDGLAVGNRSFVIRRGDGHRPILEAWEANGDPNFPKEVVGELWVVDVKESVSVAWVARSNKEMRVGEIVEVRRGY